MRYSSRTQRGVHDCSLQFSLAIVPDIARDARAEPSHPVQPRVDLCAATGNAPTAVQRFHAGHDPGEIFADGQIIAYLAVI